VCGPGEQPDPGLAGAQECRVALRGDHGGRIVGFVASVSPVDPATARWEEVAATLAGKRLNAPPGDTAARWATECVVYRLAPRDAAPESGASLPSTSLAAPPVPSEATRVPRKPFRLHRVKKRRR
ncbi:MAG: hypothetical protein ACRDXX_09470, partial [Stackebrandtia sp.]